MGKLSPINHRLKSVFLVLFIVCYGVIFLYAWQQKNEAGVLMNDVGQLVPIKVKKVVQGKEMEQIRELLQEAKEKNLKVSIAGKQHSQGGHTYYKDAIVIDMTTYNKVIQVLPEEKLATVQSGATWSDLQEAINPFHLSIKTMQAPNIFTIGGSMSVNVHGRDIRYGPLIDSIRSFRLMNADGDILNVSRTENEELFRLVNGGYGLFGIILDVDIELTEDVVYKETFTWLDYHDYPQYFKEQVLANPDIEMHNTRISVTPKQFFTEMYVKNYIRSEEDIEDHDELLDEKYIGRNKFAFGLSRHFDWGKNLVWYVQKKAFQGDKVNFVSRNNQMRPGIKFLEYEGYSDTDLLQEYFVPVDDFPDFIDRLRELLTENELNILNATVRYVPKNEESYLSYAKEDMFAIVFLINQGLTNKDIEKTGEVVRLIIDLVLEYNGAYYLPYYPYPTKEQMREAYPRTDEFFQLKRKYDPEERFMNQFYEEYA
ncbi:MAG TPA: FAD-binding oxidoreductase [Bacillaceae bacterium]|nr:FAD-binding oxidoreductase [Paenibacillus bovis]HLU21665.1 FAD-binding oxidoreductase [Bacillaceae bacterium]